MRAVAALRGRLGLIWRHVRHISIVGIFASGLPFVCFSIAAQSVPAGVMAVINAITPLFGALIAWLWLREQLSPARILGLVVGFSGILVLVWSDLSFGPGTMGGAIACLGRPCHGTPATPRVT